MAERGASMDELAKEYRTDVAIDAFRVVERRRRSLARAEEKLTELLNGSIDLPRYYAETELIRHQYEEQA